MDGKTKNVAAIILAGGKGTRIKSKKNNKVTLPFLNKPMIIYGVELLTQIAYPVVVVTGAFHQSVKKVLADHDVIFAHQSKRLGTAHATYCGLKLITKEDPDLVLIGYGDHMMFYTIKTGQSLLDYHKKQRATITLVTTVVDTPTGYGRIVRKNGNVVAIIEDKDANLEQKKIKEINAGLYCFDYLFLKNNLHKIRKSPVSGEYYLTDLIKIAVAQNKKVAGFTVPYHEVGMGVNRQEELDESQKIYQTIHARN